MGKEAFNRPRLVLLRQLPLHSALPRGTKERAQQLRGLRRQPEQHALGDLPGTVQAQESQRLASLLNNSAALPNYYMLQHVH